MDYFSSSPHWTPALRLSLIKPLFQRSLYRYTMHTVGGICLPFLWTLLWASLDVVINHCLHPSAAAESSLASRLGKGKHSQSARRIVQQALTITLSVMENIAHQRRQRKNASRTLMLAWERYRARLSDKASRLWVRVCVLKLSLYEFGCKQATIQCLSVFVLWWITTSALKELQYKTPG